MTSFDIPTADFIDRAMRSGAIAFETDPDGELVVSIHRVRNPSSPITIGGIAAALCGEGLRQA